MTEQLPVQAGERGAADDPMQLTPAEDRLQRKEALLSDLSQNTPSKKLFFSTEKTFIINDKR